MKMLRYLGLMVIVVCLTAFASGCGGGGGGSAMMEEEMPPVMVMECPQGQVGTYPDCMDPGPTDAELIADAQDTLADIVTDARVRETAAQAAYRAVTLHPDATDAQIDLALDYAFNAQTFLAEITAAIAAVNAATTPAQAEMALAEARAALADLTLAQSGAESIQIALQTVATPPPGQTVTAFTGGSPLIQHVRDNSIINEAVLMNLVATDLDVGTTTPETNASSFPVDSKGTDGKTIRGELSVTARSLSSTIRGTTDLPSISGIGSGFDMKMENGTTTYVNAYTDISKARNVRIKTEVDGDDTRDGNQPTFDTQPMSDADYLLLGIWLTVPDADTSGAKMGAFAYGSRSLVPITDLPKYDPNDPDIDQADLGADADSVSFRIIDFVDDNKDLTATYRGKVTGAFLADGKATHLQASVELTAEFRDTDGSTGEGDIGGTINNITASGESVDGYIDLVKKIGHNDLTGEIEDGVASGVVANQPYTGSWKGQFFEPRYSRTTMQEDGVNENDPKKTLYVYTPQAPGSFAGAFQVKKSGVSDAGIIGAFGAKR